MMWIRLFFWNVVPHRCVAGRMKIVLPSHARPGLWYRLRWCRRCTRLMPHDGYFASEAAAEG